MLLTLSRDREQNKVVFNYIRDILGVPALNQMFIACLADEIELSNEITIAVKTSDYRAVRDVTIFYAIAD